MGLVTLFALLATSVVVTAVARKMGWPAPLLIVGIASAVSFVPAVPDFEIDPELVLTVVLPPLLYASALDVSLVSLREVNRSIWRLGVLLVIISAFAVGAVIFVLVPDMSWPVALLVGAIVAPPDAVSAVAIGRRVGLPRRVMTILTGESLVNDASSLTLFKVSLAIVGGAALTVGDDLWVFFQAVVVGIGVGAILGLLFLWLRRLFRDPPIQVLLGLVLPFFAYVGAEHIGGSGVLAVVTAGFVVGYNAHQTDYQLRLQERPVWSAVNLLLEGFVFALIGLQFQSVAESLEQGDRGLLWMLGVATAVLATCVGVRFFYVFLSSGVGNLRALRRAAQRQAHDASTDDSSGFAAWRRRRLLDRRGEVVLSWREMFVISWSGMRGVVTMAAAVSVPAITTSGVAVPAHDMIVFVAFVVTVGTLLLQGLTLPWVARGLGVVDADQAARDEQTKNRFLRISLEEAVAGLVADAKESPELYPGVGAELIDSIRSRIARSEGGEDADRSSAPTRVISRANALTDAHTVAQMRESVVQVRRDILQRRREILDRERNAGTLEEEVVREILLGFDASELLLDHHAF